jgi:hypothetical protein
MFIAKTCFHPRTWVEYKNHSDGALKDENKDGVRDLSSKQEVHRLTACGYDT